MADTIMLGQTLVELQSSDERFTFIFQQDGNLVLYDGESQVDETPLWASNTVGRFAKYCLMQDDNGFGAQFAGNLVIYDTSNNPIWTSGSVVGGVLGKLQTDGNFVIYDSGNNPLWATGTNIASPADHAVKTPSTGHEVKHGGHEVKPHEIKPQPGKHEAKQPRAEQEIKPQPGKH